MKDLLSNIPDRGQGLNIWLMKAAHRIKHQSLTLAQMCDSLRQATEGKGIHPGEIERALGTALDQTYTGKKKPKWPARDSAAIAAITAKGGGVSALCLASPMHFSENDPHVGTMVMDTLWGHPGVDPLVCAGRSAYSFTTRPWSEIREGIGDCSLIVPSPMTARTGLTQKGKVSEHTLLNTGPRKYLVIEQDKGTDHEQASILLHLATMAPMAVVCSSGGKSLHGWFNVEGIPEERVAPFFAYAVKIGADPALWTPCQFARIPGGTRDNGNRQSVLFFNPALCNRTPQRKP